MTYVINKIPTAAGYGLQIQNLSCMKKNEKILPVIKEIYNSMFIEENIKKAAAVKQNLEKDIFERYEDILLSAKYRITQL